MQHFFRSKDAMMNFLRSHTRYSTMNSWNGTSSFMDMDDLRATTRLVQSFDQLCDNIVEFFIRYCNENAVVENVVMVPQTVKSVQEREPVLSLAT